MPYDAECVEGHDSVVREVQKSARTLAKEVKPETLERAERIQWVNSSFSDPGEDWARADFYDAQGTLLQSVVVSGY